MGAQGPPASRAQAALALSILASCARPLPSTPAAATATLSIADAAAPEVPSLPQATGAAPASAWSVDYDGTLSAPGSTQLQALDGVRVTMHLARSGFRVSGVYEYAAYARPIALEGSVDEACVLHLDERVADRGTGKLTLTGDPSCELTGSWSDPAGKRSLDAAFTPLCIPLVAPQDSAASRAPTAPIQPRSRGEVLDFLVRLANHHHAPADRAFFDRRIDESLFPVSEAAARELGAHKIILRPPPVYATAARLYVADVDNDGTANDVYVLENHCAGCGASIEGIYDAAGDEALPVVVDLQRARACGPHREQCFPGQLDTPAILVGPEGTEMHFKEDRYVDRAGRGTNETAACGRIHDAYRVIANGRHARVLEHTRTVVPCREP